MSTGSALTFQAPEESGFPFVLFWCVTTSLLAHAATFFLFQVVYPQRVTIPSPAPHVSLLLPDSPENIALLRWIEAEDPALIAADNSVPPPGLTEVRYQPSFATPRTAPLGPPVEKPQAVRFPPAVDRLITEKAPTGATPAAFPAAPTALRFSGDLASRPLAQHPPLEFAHRATAPVSATSLLIGVNAAGAVRHVFLQQSCGDTRLDELATGHIRRVAFTPAEAGITWAQANFAWGGDAYALENSGLP